MLDAVLASLHRSSVAQEASVAQAVVDSRERSEPAHAPLAVSSGRSGAPLSPSRSPSAPSVLAQAAPAHVQSAVSRQSATKQCEVAGAHHGAADGKAWQVSRGGPPSDPGVDAGAHLIASAADSASIESSLAAQRAQRGEALQAGAGHPSRGRLRARVVIADLNAAGGKDYVVYQIRVADDVGEWAVARRYRSFEVLHRQLKQLPCYR